MHILHVMEALAALELFSTVNSASASLDMWSCVCMVAC